MVPSLAIVCPNCAHTIQLHPSNSIIHQFQQRPELQHFEMVCENQLPGKRSIGILPGRVRREKCLQAILVWPKAHQLQEAIRQGWSIRVWRSASSAVVAAWQAHGQLTPPSAL
jgi:hypothetical protein